MSAPYVSMCGVRIKAISHLCILKIFPSIFIGGPQNDYLAHTVTCLPSRSNCIRRTLNPAVLGQVDEDGRKVL